MPHGWRPSLQSGLSCRSSRQTSKCVCKQIAAFVDPAYYRPAPVLLVSSIVYDCLVQRQLSDATCPLPAIIGYISTGTEQPPCGCSNHFNSIAALLLLTIADASALPLQPGWCCCAGPTSILDQSALPKALPARRGQRGHMRAGRCNGGCSDKGHDLRCCRASAEPADSRKTCFTGSAAIIVQVWDQQRHVVTQCMPNISDNLHCMT